MGLCAPIVKYVTALNSRHYGKGLMGMQGESQIFHATTGGGRALAKEMDVPFLGAVPLDPRIGVACDYGESFFDAYPESPACDGLMGIIRGLREQMGLEQLPEYEE